MIKNERKVKKMKNNLTNKEYAERLSEIRPLLWKLAQDMGAVYSTELQYANKIYNDVLHADLVKLSEA